MAAFVVDGHVMGGLTRTWNDRGDKFVDVDGPQILIQLQVSLIPWSAFSAAFEIQTHRAIRNLHMIQAIQIVRTCIPVILFRMFQRKC